MNRKIRISLVDDHAILRDGLTSLLEEHEELKIVSRANNGKDFIETLAIEIPDLVILDIEMPVMNGIKTAEYIQKHYPQIRILMLTTHDDSSFVIHLASIGVRGYLVKGIGFDHLYEAICSIAETGYYINDFISMDTLEKLANGNMISPLFKEVVLSEREKEVISFLCNEFSNKEIADKLSVNVRTIETHRENIMKKIGARNIAGVICYGIKNKINLLHKK